MKTKVYFRADGNAQIGLGHVIRCCAVAEMLRSEFDCAFFIRKPSEYLRRQVTNVGCKLVEFSESDGYEKEAEDWASTLDGSEIIVLDGYNFTTGYQQILRDKGCILVCIDDIHAYHFLADAVINHAGGISALDYSSVLGTQFYLGPKYSLIRPEFSARKAEDKMNRDLLICMGGADPHNEILNILKQVVDRGFSKIRLVVGAGYKFDAILNEYLTRNAARAVEVHKNIDAREMAELMLKSSYAILSPSSVAFEYMAVNGVVYLHQIADNQKDVKKYFLKQGLAFDLKDLGAKSDTEEFALIEKQRQYFDGKYIYRIRNIFRNLLMLRETRIRTAEPQDLELTFFWANDRQARAMSLSSAPIEFDQHNVWFQKKIADPHSFYYVIEDFEKPFGQVRFDFIKEGHFFQLSYSIDEDYRGKNLGSVILSLSLTKLQKDLNYKPATIVAYVKEQNKASIYTFEHTKFRRQLSSEFANTFKYTLNL